MDGIITIQAVGEVRDADGNLVSTSPVTFEIDASTLPEETVRAIIEQQQQQEEKDHD